MTGVVTHVAPMWKPSSGGPNIPSTRESFSTTSVSAYSAASSACDSGPITRSAPTDGSPSLPDGETNVVTCGSCSSRSTDAASGRPLNHTSGWPSRRMCSGRDGRADGGSGCAKTSFATPLRTRKHGASGRISASVSAIQRASVMNETGRACVMAARTRSAGASGSKKRSSML